MEVEGRTNYLLGELEKSKYIQARRAEGASTMLLVQKWPVLLAASLVEYDRRCLNNVVVSSCFHVKRKPRESSKENHGEFHEETDEKAAGKQRREP